MTRKAHHHVAYRWHAHILWRVRANKVATKRVSTAQEPGYFLLLVVLGVGMPNNVPGCHKLSSNVTEVKRSILLA